MDFGAFGDGSGSANNGQFRSNVQNPVNNTTQTQQANNNTGTRSSAVEDDGNAVFMHNTEHSGVFCDICEGSIRGFRYKCMQCPDFDLCSICERKGHHAGHVMMRISFPEQTRDAIRRYCNNAPASPPSMRGVPDPLAGFPFGRHRSHHGHGHGRRCHRTREEPEADASVPGNGKESEDSGGEDQRFPNGCPYYTGKKGMKKWAKCMKKMAHQHRRSAETYAKSCGQTAEQAAGVGGQTTGTENSSGLDFTAAASQIQEFLNAFGIPIDVVELYDSFGNRGEPGTGQAEGTTTGNGTQNTSNPETGTPREGVDVDANKTATSASETPVQPATPTAAATVTSAAQQAALAAHFGQLHLNVMRPDIVTNDGNKTSVAASAPVQESLANPMAVDFDGEASGWTLLDNERAANGNATELNTVAPVMEPIPATQTTGQGHVSFSMPNSGGQSLSSEQSRSIGNSNGVNNGNLSSTTNTSGAGSSMYPILSQPQFHQLLSGVSQAVNSVVRNIPIVTNPSGPGSLTAQQPESTSGSPQEMDVKCITTLNQLLAMGFSNHDGWLSRLVMAKKGDLEAVLNALFPTNTA